MRHALTQLQRGGTLPPYRWPTSLRGDGSIKRQEQFQMSIWDAPEPVPMSKIAGG